MSLRERFHRGERGRIIVFESDTYDPDMPWHYPDEISEPKDPQIIKLEEKLSRASGNYALLLGKGEDTSEAYKKLMKCARKLGRATGIQPEAFPVFSDSLDVATAEAGQDQAPLELTGIEEEQTPLIEG